MECVNQNLFGLTLIPIKVFAQDLRCSNKYSDNFSKNFIILINNSGMLLDKNRQNIPSIMRLDIYMCFMGSHK